MSNNLGDVFADFTPELHSMSNDAVQILLLKLSARSDSSVDVHTTQETVTWRMAQHDFLFVVICFATLRKMRSAIHFLLITKLMDAT